MNEWNVSKRLVVYADDDPDNLMMVEESFSHFSAGIRLITFNNGARALDWLQDLPGRAPLPGLIILDIDMPGLNGREVLAQLRKMDAYQTVPIILFSSSASPYDQEFAQGHKARFVSKPAGYTQLEKLTQDFINYGRMWRS